MVGDGSFAQLPDLVFERSANCMNRSAKEDIRDMAFPELSGGVLDCSGFLRTMERPINVQTVTSLAIREGTPMSRTSSIRLPGGYRPTSGSISGIIWYQYAWVVLQNNCNDDATLSNRYGITDRIR